MTPLLLTTLFLLPGSYGSETTASSTASSTISTATSLPQFVQEVPACALLCYDAACIDSNCNIGDFSCVCGNPNSLVVKMGICAGKYCDDSKSFDTGDWLADMCGAYQKSPASDVVFTASSMLVSEVSAASATATKNPLPTSNADSGGNSATVTPSTSGTAATASASSTAGGASLASAPLLLISVCGAAIAATFPL